MGMKTMFIYFPYYLFSLSLLLKICFITEFKKEKCYIITQYLTSDLPYRSFEQLDCEAVSLR